jgi:hypothetical protein
MADQLPVTTLQLNGVSTIHYSLLSHLPHPWAVTTNPRVLMGMGTGASANTRGLPMQMATRQLSAAVPEFSELQAYLVKRR